MFAVILVMLLPLCVHGADVLAPPDIGFGVIDDYATHGESWPQAMAAMVALGCNTMTIYGHGGTDGTDIARQVDAGLDAGLIDTRFPALWLPSVTHEEDLLALSLSMRSVGDQSHTPHRLPVTSQTPAHHWPELVGCNMLMPTTADRDRVKALADAYRRGAALKSGAFVSLSVAGDLRDLLDVAILPAAEWDADGVKASRVHRAWAWAQMVDEPEQQRRATGLWAYVNRPDVLLFAGWMPGCPGEAGLGDGICDYRVLRALDKAAKRKINSATGAEAWAWLRGLTMDVPGDCATIRAKAEEYLQKLQ